MQPNDQPHNRTTATALPTLAQALFDELTATVRGEVYPRGESQYVIHKPPSLGLLFLFPLVPT